MRAREMHPLCCIAMDGPGPACGSCSGEADARLSPPPQPPPSQPPPADREVRVVGVLYKWTNFGRGWRSRWFSLRGGVLSYSKVRVLPDPGGGACGRAGSGDFRLIGDPSAARLRRKARNSVGIVHLKVSSFRESKSDDRRFYIFSATKTLHLRTNTNKDRIAWIEALISARCTFVQKPFSERISFLQNNISLSTEKLRSRLLREGLDETLIRDCEQIMQLEFSQLKHAYQEHFNLLSFPKLELVNVESEAVGLQEIHLLSKNGFSNSGHGKFSESSTTESSDDVERQEVDDDLSAEDEVSYYDATDSFSEPSSEIIENNSGSVMKMHPEIGIHHDKFSQVERRKFLPVCTEKEKGVSLWSIIKDNVGKDLTRVCLPVYFNEPLSSLQKCFEDMEYSYLLDQAFEYGKMGNSLMRILNVAAFAVSGYASSDGRPCKPFNPLLGETYEADFPEKGIRFFSEKVSHHPMLVACHCEGRGWKFWGDSNLKSKFWGRSIQLDPVGVLTLEFDDGEIFQWSKVTTSIYNLIFGKIYCDHHGIMHIQGNRQYSCNLKFKEQSLLDRNPRQVQGYVEDGSGNKVASLVGKWDDSMYYSKEGDLSRAIGSNSLQGSSLLWKRNDPSPNPTRYNLSSFAITLNELTSELQEKLPPTDSRRRPDQRHLENGEYDKANSEKQRLEKRQRMSRKLQESGWKPRWFHRDDENGTFRYIGGYWEAREQKNWDGCPDIFGEFTDDTDLSSFK